MQITAARRGSGNNLKWHTHYPIDIFKQSVAAIFIGIVQFKIDSIGCKGTGLNTIADRGTAIAKKQMRDFGGMVSFEVKGGKEAAARLLDNMEICSLAVRIQPELKNTLSPIP